MRDVKRQRRPEVPMFEVLEPRLLLDAGLILSEFMANNASVLKDAEGDYSDWIEIYNSTAAPVNLEGWCLRDSKDTWEFPAGAASARTRRLSDTEPSSVASAAAPASIADCGLRIAD